jgi:hypothetical protein
MVCCRQRRSDVPDDGSARPSAVFATIFYGRKHSFIVEDTTVMAQQTRKPTLIGALG